MDCERVELHEGSVSWGGLQAQDAEEGWDLVDECYRGKSIQRHWTPEQLSDRSTVADLFPRRADTYSALLKNLERVPPRYVDRARTTLKGLIGEIRLFPEDDALMAECELEDGKLLAAADTKISVVDTVKASGSSPSSTFGRARR